MIIVTGTAPRCGTSAMMRLLLQEFKPHSMIEAFPEYTAKEKNPEGFWDIKAEYVHSSDEIPYEEGTVIKLWAPHFYRVDTSKVKAVILLTRDNMEEQARSIYDCAIAEGFPPLMPEHILQLFKNQQSGIKAYFSNTKLLRVKMEDLKEFPEQVLAYIKEII